MSLPEVERKEVAKKWQTIVKSYETLTNEATFDKWVTYGNPDGSYVQQSFDIALPEWVN